MTFDRCDVPSSATFGRKTIRLDNFDRMSYLTMFFDQMSYSANCRIDQKSYATNCRIGETVFDELSCTHFSDYVPLLIEEFSYS